MIQAESTHGHHNTNAVRMHSVRESERARGSAPPIGPTGHGGEGNASFPRVP